MRSKLLVFLLLPFFFNTYAQNCKEIVGYYPNWQWYDRGGLVKPSTIDYSKYTVINYAFFKPEPNGSISSWDSWADDNLLLGPMNWSINLPDSTQSLPYRCHQNNVKILISIGGWTLSDNFPQIAASAVKRANFAHSCVQLINQYHLDGVDIDWEYPGFVEHSGTTADKQNFTIFLQQIKDSLNALTAQTNKSYLLTAALPAGPDNMSNIEWSNIVPILDFMNIMTYDFFGSWDNNTNHNAPLYKPNQGTAQFNIDSAVHKLTTFYNVPNNKINIGVAFYGRSAKTVNNAALFGAIANHQVDNSTFSDDDGIPLYYNILKKMNLFTNHWDSVAKVPYLTGNGNLKTFVSYDDTTSIALKAQYINSKNLRGAIIWEITGDYIETAPNSGIIAGTPLANKLKSVLCSNTIVNCQPSFSTSSITICSNQIPFSWNGNNYSSSGTYIALFQNAQGCDSTAQLVLTIIATPTINAGTDITICFGQSVSLSATSNSNSISWNNNINNNQTFYPNQTSSFVATASSNNCSNSDTILVTVNPKPNASAGGNKTICSGNSTTLTASGGSNYWWNTGATTNQITITNSGSYYVVATNSFGCMDTSTFVQVNFVNLPSMVKIKSTTSYSDCEPNTIQLVLDHPAGSFAGLNFQWFQNGSPLIGETDSVLTSFQSGIYHVMISDNGTCFKNSGTKSIIIKPKPTANFTANGPTTICAGSSVNLVAPTITGYTYTWLKDGQSVGSGVNKIFKLAGDYSVVAKLNGCTDTSTNSTTVIVNPLPTASISALTSTSFCSGDSCLLAALPSNGSNYQWYIGNTLLTSSTIPYKQVTTNGTFKVIVVDSNNCVSKLSSNNVKTKVNSIPIATISFMGNGTIPLNGSLKLNASPSSGVSWQWYKDGVIILGATNKTYFASMAGSYTVEVSKLGCVGVSAAAVLSASSNKEVELTTENEHWMIYPNPTSNTLYVTYKGNDPLETEVKLINATGQLVFQSIEKTNEISIDLSGFQAGIYFLSLRQSNEKMGWFKLIKVEE